MAWVSKNLYAYYINYIFGHLVSGIFFNHSTKENLPRVLERIQQSEDIV